MIKSESVQENDTSKIVWVFYIQTDDSMQELVNE